MKDTSGYMHSGIVLSGIKGLVCSKMFSKLYGPTNGLWDNIGSIFLDKILSKNGSRYFVVISYLLKKVNL